MVPRSYDKEIPEGKPGPFLLTNNHPEHFRSNYDNLLTKAGQETLRSRVNEHETFYKSRKDKEDDFAKYKRKHVAAMELNKWKPNVHVQKEFSAIPVDD